MQFIDIVIFGFALVVPWFALIVSAFPYRWISSLIALSIAFCVPYVLIIFLAKLEGDRLDAAIAQFDLNGDGVFSAAELTPAAEAALQQYSNDTGLAMAPIFGGVGFISLRDDCWIPCVHVQSATNLTSENADAVKKPVARMLASGFE